MDNCSKIKSLLYLDDISVDNLSIEQKLLLQYFSFFFFVRFWSQGLKIFITSVNIGAPSMPIFMNYWVDLFDFCFKVPSLLNELRFFIYIPNYENLSDDVCLELFLYLNFIDSFLYIFAVHHDYFVTQGLLYFWKNCSMALQRHLIYSCKDLDSNFLFYF